MKNRVHLDLVPGGSRAGELAREESLGARVIADRRRVAPGGWVVMADPEGDECDLEGGVEHLRCGSATRRHRRGRPPLPPTPGALSLAGGFIPDIRFSPAIARMNALLPG